MNGMNIVWCQKTILYRDDRIQAGLLDLFKLKRENRSTHAMSFALKNICLYLWDVENKYILLYSMNQLYHE